MVGLGFSLPVWESHHPLVAWLGSCTSPSLLCGLRQGHVSSGPRGPDPSRFLTKQAGEGSSSQCRDAHLCGAWGGTGIPLRAFDLQAGVGVGEILDKLPDACPLPSPQIWGAVTRTTMTQVCRLGLLLALLLPVVGTSMPGTVVRLNKAALSYGKSHVTGLPRVCLCTSICE